MEKEPKKISFGFNKLSKRTTITNIRLNIEAPTKPENKVQLIECLEEKSIKVIGGDESVSKGPLIIPMKQPNKKLINLVDIVKNNFVETIEDIEILKSNENNDNVIKDEPILSELSLEEQAAKELLNASKKIEKKDENKRIIEVDKEKLVFEGEKESNLDDYENVPVEEFGKAMLRGMGWKDGCGIGKNEKVVKVAQPAIRPKGMGLGADKITKQDSNAKPAVDREGKVLTCVKRAFVKVIAGYHKGSYGQIIGLDDESGRFIIKTAINNINISLNEFLVVPVTKEEYNKNSKIINNAKYEEFMKKKEEEEKRILEKAKTKKYDSDEDKYKQNKSRVKKERKSESSDDNDEKYKREQKYKSKNTKKTSDAEAENIEKFVKKEKYLSDSDEDTLESKKRESKYKSKNDYEERRYKDRQRNTDYKSKYSSDSGDIKYKSASSKQHSSKYDSEEEDKKKNRDMKNRDMKTRDKYSKYNDSENEEKCSTSKYDSEEEYKRYRKNRDKEREKKSNKYSDTEDDKKYKEREKKSKKYSDIEDDRKYKKSTAKHDEDYNKKKGKKKKSKTYSSDESEDQYKRKSKKDDKKYNSDSGDDKRKTYKKDKGRYERDGR